MKYQYRGCFLFACIVSAGLCTRATATPLDQGENTYTVVTFGDSTTAPRKVGGSDLEIYTDVLRKDFERKGIAAEVINAGVSSDTTVRARKRFEKDVLQHEPDVVIIQFGLNDSCIDVHKGKDTPRVSLDDYKDNLNHFVETLKARGSQVILMTQNPMLWNENLKALYGQPPYDVDDRWGFNLLNERYADAVRALAKAQDIPLLDVYQRYLDYDRLAGQATDDLLLDGMHPNTKGQAMTGRLLMDQITRMPGGPFRGKPLGVGGGRGAAPPAP